jgi:signal transduction histidine kinase
MRRLDLRRRLTLTVTIGAALVLAALVAGFNIALRASLSHDANNVVTARAAAALSGVEIDRGVVRGETPDQGAVDALVWLYSGPHAIERPPAPQPLQSAADSLTVGPRRSVENAQYDVRLASEPIVQGGRRVGTAVAGLSVVPYERTASRALVASVIFGLVAFVLIVVATRFIVRGALRPVAQMTAEAADWSEHDLDHRFQAGEPHDELTRLAATFDSMLDRLAASLRHEQRFSAEVSHELKTPLAAIAAEADLALRRDRAPGEYRQALEAIASRSRQLEGILEMLLASAKGELAAVGTADASTVANRCHDACAPIAVENGVDLSVVPPSAPLRIGVDSDAAERVLAPLVENACRYARTHAEIRLRSNGDHVEYLVTDDGPGVSPSERERIFEPGKRGSAAAAGEATDGAGLGLALARRLARALDGEVRYAPLEAAFIFEAPKG